jgi:hypothetical protein
MTLAPLLLAIYKFLDSVTFHEPVNLENWSKSMQNAFIFAKERSIMSTKKFTDLDIAKGASNYMYYANIPTFLKC